MIAQEITTFEDLMLLTEQDMVCNLKLPIGVKNRIL